MSRQPATIKLTTTDELHRVLQLFSSDPDTFVFRGLSNASYPLNHSLERGFSNRHDLDELSKYSFERSSIDLIKERIHLYNEYQNTEVDTNFKLLTIFRHYGGATRFVDVTRSLLVAMYFCFGSGNNKGNPVIWAINTFILDGRFGRAKGSQKDDDGTFVKEAEKLSQRLSFDFPGLSVQERITLRNIRDQHRKYWKLIRDNIYGEFFPESGVIHTFDAVKNRRSLYQQGEYLVPFNIHIPFFQNLLCALEIEEYPSIDDWKTADLDLERSSTPLIRIEINRSLLSELWSIIRSYNVSGELIYPDLHGFVDDFNKLIRFGR